MLHVNCVADCKLLGPHISALRRVIEFVDEGLALVRIVENRFIGDQSSLLEFILLHILHDLPVIGNLSFERLQFRLQFVNGCLPDYHSLVCLLQQTVRLCEVLF